HLHRSGHLVTGETGETGTGVHRWRQGVCHRTRRLARAHHPRLPSTVARIVALVGRRGHTSSRSPSVARATLEAVSKTANARPIEIAPLSTRLVPSGAVRVCAERMDPTDAQ